MNNKNYFDITQPALICVGTGLLVLDVVINEHKKTTAKSWAGGSCGNVLTILSYLGWDAYPIARIGKDTAAEKIKFDLKKYSVKLDFITSETQVNSPIIVEKIYLKGDGKPNHKFLLVCPHCGVWFPRYKAILLKNLQFLLEALPKANTFYFDKVSPASIKLANQARAQGGLVFFEPSSIGNKSLFQKALQTCHILKYASDRLGNIKELTKELPPLLQIETLGAEGLRYRRRVGNQHQEEWQKLPAFEVRDFRDAAGCGDWCSAGIIHLLGRDGSANLENINNNDLVEALRFGQALAALNCQFEGARGGMYVLQPESLKLAVQKIMLGEKVKYTTLESITENIPSTVQSVCSSCIQQLYSTKMDSQKCTQETVLRSLALKKD